MYFLLIGILPTGLAGGRKALENLVRSGGPADTTTEGVRALFRLAIFTFVAYLISGVLSVLFGFAGAALMSPYLIFLGLRKLLAKKNLSVRQFWIIYLATLAGVALLFLAYLHPVFALLGVVLPSLAHYLGPTMQGKQFTSLFKTLRGSGSESTFTGPEVSEVETKYIRMILFHDTVVIDGQVRKGRFKGEKLSQLELNELLHLLDEVKQDEDSFELLATYLRRAHEGWQAGRREQQAPPPGKDDMTEAFARVILGLDEDETDEAAIIEAYRQLILKVHPDKGGSKYLAQQVNKAKERLID